MNEEKLLSELKGNEKGAVNALEKLIKQYTPYVYSVIARIIGSGRAEDCEELSADVFAAVWENRLRINEGSFTAYLAAIARNKAFGLLRKNAPSLPLDEGLEDVITVEAGNPEKELSKGELGQILSNALLSLEKQQRELFVRHYYYGETIKEAAEKLNINLSTAKSWIYRGKEVLKTALEQQEFDKEDFYE